MSMEGLEHPLCKYNHSDRADCDSDSDCAVISKISSPGSSMWQTDREMRLSGSANCGTVQD